MGWEPGARGQAPDQALSTLRVLGDQGSLGRLLCSGSARPEHLPRPLLGGAVLTSVCLLGGGDTAHALVSLSVPGSFSRVTCSRSQIKSATAPGRGGRGKLLLRCPSAGAAPQFRRKPLLEGTCYPAAAAANAGRPVGDVLIAGPGRAGNPGEV